MKQETKKGKNRITYLPVVPPVLREMKEIIDEEYRTFLKKHDFVTIESENYYRSKNWKSTGKRCKSTCKIHE